MTPAVYNPTIYQGEDVTQSFTFPFDLSTYTAIRIEIRTGTGGTLLAEFDLDGGLAISGDGNTVLLWTITDAQSAALPTTNQYKPSYDLRLTDAGGLEHYYIKGNVSVTPRVTTGAES